jgi:hypothetical protein
VRSHFPALVAGNCERIGVTSLAQVTTPIDDADAQVATELAELEALAAAMSEDEVEGVPPVQGPQDWE